MGHFITWYNSTTFILNDRLKAQFGKGHHQQLLLDKSSPVIKELWLETCQVEEILNQESKTLWKKMKPEDTNTQ